MSTGYLHESLTSDTAGVSLFPYGPSARDQEFVRRTVDFTSPLFKPQIGFPFGSSLRDFLYFTDNGQIIFPESEYQIFAYPNPFLRGFTGWDAVALVAPFWDDADFSSCRGTVFYQEYETLYGEYNPLIWQVESWIKKLTNNWNYKARWTLKVTWVNATAYPAQWTFGTNTYQAILSTDGSRSYTLFLYESGGMRWDVTQHPYNSALMGFSSGDGYWENSALTSQLVWKKYRPDQFLDPNSGLRGLQVYRLHREERPNYRLRCLQWLKTQPERPAWGWPRASCPCSWQQGLWDLRFQPTSTGWWGLGGRQLCSFSSWRGGLCCSYGPWGELLTGWPVQTPWQFDQELEPQNWCCRWNDRPSFCALYQQRWPRIGCAGYRPLWPAWMFGDPHITTFDGVNYTFNGLGDFVLVQAQDGNSSFLMQGRTAQTGSAQASNFVAFAAQYHSGSLVDPFTVQWILKPSDTIHVQLNNQTVTFDTNHEDAEGQEIFNDTGVVITRNGSLVSASFDGTVTVSVIALSNILHASCSLPEEYRDRTGGLLGVWNDDPGDDFRMPDGSTLPPGSSEETLFHYGMTWKVNETSLFGKRDNHLPSNFTPVFLSQLLGNKSLDGNLTSECNGEEQCIYDTLATQNTSIGLYTQMLFRRYQTINITLNQYPPSIMGDHVVEAYIGQTRKIQYTSSSEDVAFTLRSSNPNFKLFLTSNPFQVAGCKCDANTFGHFCERSKDLCEEQCFQNVKCIPGEGCEDCPLNMTGDGRHCAALQNSSLCWNKSCPVDYCYNRGHCSISQTLGCQPTCTCPPAFTDNRCFLAGNNFIPTTPLELPERIIQLSLSEEENASMAEVNASVSGLQIRELGHAGLSLEQRRATNVSGTAPTWSLGLLLPSQPLTVPFPHSNPPVALASGRGLQRWRVISKFQYLPRGPVIHFLNTQLLDAVVQAFLLQTSGMRQRHSDRPRNNVVFHPISREDVCSVTAWEDIKLKSGDMAQGQRIPLPERCNGYKGYHMAYSPQSGLTCVSPCREGYCEHGGQCQHLPNGPRCSCVPFSIYTPWGVRCEYLSVKLGAFFGILFGALGVLLVLAIMAFVVLRFWGCPRKRYSYTVESKS
ncbi:hypothetical protein MC885_020227 [Smutsia gigantea]|nr:hypothetical protein MC885_020227 [Smutsia gigantea]